MSGGAAESRITQMRGHRAGCETGSSVSLISDVSCSPRMWAERNCGACFPSWQPTGASTVTGCGTTAFPGRRVVWDLNDPSGVEGTHWAGDDPQGATGPTPHLVAFQIFDTLEVPPLGPGIFDLGNDIGYEVKVSADRPRLDLWWGPFPMDLGQSVNPSQ